MTDKKETPNLTEQVFAQLAKEDPGFTLEFEGETSEPAGDVVDPPMDGEPEVVKTESKDSDKTGDSVTTSLSLPDSVTKAINSGDLEALQEALNLTTDQAAKIFKIDAADLKAAHFAKREARRRDKEFETRSTDLEKKFDNRFKELNDVYGDPIKARKAFKSGDTYAFFETASAWAGVPVVDIMKAWQNEIKGKPTKELQEKAELAEYRRKAEAEKKPEEIKTEAEKPTEPNNEKVTKAKDWVKDGLKGTDFEDYPGIVDLCYDVLKKGFRKGTLDTPAKALVIVKENLKKFGLGANGKKESVMEKSPPKRGSNSMINSKTRKMTDRELANYLLTTEFNNGENF